ncbi:MAG: hypothetical protein NPIRA02_17910 [Nitrospirales bacterium]|nr:MAG: hypothetical protein NPIRA02_17910 [Nitrospirales bacterium]
MDTPIASSEIIVHLNNPDEKIQRPQTSTTLEQRLSSDSDASAILRKRRLRRGRAIAATAASTAVRVSGKV